jgi:hypothetical protein
MAAESRVWSDTTGEYTLEGKLIALGESTVVLQRADHELVAIPIDKLSQKDRDYLTSKEARAEADKLAEAAQTWTLRDDTKLVGRLVDYARRDLTIQRRRGRIYVNDRRFESLPEFYQQLVPKIVADREMLPRADRRSFENWVLQQRGQPRTFQVEGIVVELENGDEYAVPFALLTDDDLKVSKPGWDEWLAAHSSNKYAETEDLGFLLRSLAAARQQDQMVQRRDCQDAAQASGSRGGRHFAVGGDALSDRPTGGSTSVGGGRRARQPASDGQCACSVSRICCGPGSQSEQALANACEKGT